jgi:hypothetical protein
MNVKYILNKREIPDFCFKKSMSKVAIKEKGIKTEEGPSRIYYLLAN